MSRSLLIALTALSLSFAYPHKSKANKEPKWVQGGLPVDGILCYCQDIGAVDTQALVNFPQADLWAVIKGPGYDNIKYSTGYPQGFGIVWTMEYKVPNTNFKTITLDFLDIDGTVDFVNATTAIEYTAPKGVKENPIVQTLCRVN